MKLTLSQASDLVNKIENAGSRVGDMIMPNGLRFDKCSREYCHEIANALEDAMVELADELAANDAEETLQ